MMMMESDMVMCEDEENYNQNNMMNNECYSMQEEGEGEDEGEQRRNIKIEKMNIRNNLYKESGKSMEYGETHYSTNWEYFPHNELINPSLFWADLAKFLVSNKQGNLTLNFLSKNIILPTTNMTELICLLSVLDLPISTSSHKFNRKEGRGLEIITSSNMIFFTKEIKETDSDLKSYLTIAQHLSLYLNKEKSVKELIVGEIYSHETIVTNISSSKLFFYFFYVGEKKSSG